MLVLNVVLNLLLIPRMGIVGAAVAWSISLAAVNGVRVWQVWHIMRVTPFGGGIPRAVGAAAVAAVATLLVTRLVDPWWLDLVVGAAVTVSVYPLLVWRLGVSVDDLHVLSAVLGRRRRRRRAAAATST